VVQKRILPVAHIDKPCIQVGHDFPDATDVNVAHGVLHVSTVAVQLHELTIFQDGNVNALGRRIDDEFRVHHMKYRDLKLQVTASTHVHYFFL
jgi:hypothetical protein